MKKTFKDVDSSLLTAIPNPDKKTYEKMMQSLNSIDLTQVTDDDNDDFGNNPACAGGACDL